MSAYQVLDRGALGEELRCALEREITIVGEFDLGLGDHAAGVDGQHDDPSAQKHGFLDVVRHHEHRRARVPPYPPDEDLHVLLGLDVERSERLVEQHHVGLAHQRAGDGHPLLLAARELAGQRMLEAGEADLGQVPLDPAPTLGLVQRQQLQPERNVALDRSPRVEGLGLEHQAAVGSGAGDRMAVEDDLAFGRHGKARDE